MGKAKHRNKRTQLWRIPFPNHLISRYKGLPNSGNIWNSSILLLCKCSTSPSLSKLPCSSSQLSQAETVLCLLQWYPAGFHLTLPNSLNTLSVNSHHQTFLHSLAKSSLSFSSPLHSLLSCPCLPHVWSQLQSPSCLCYKRKPHCNSSAG